jgi:hypothetical protein
MVINFSETRKFSLISLKLAETFGLRISKSFLKLNLLQLGAKKTTGHGTSNSTKPAQENKKITHSIRSCDTKLAQLILDEVIEGGSPVTWDDISGQEVSKDLC